MTALNVYPLVRRAATASAAIAVLSSAILVIPLMLNMRVRCVDNDGQHLGALIGSGYVLGASLFIGVGCLAILNRLQVGAGEDRADADRTTLWSLGVAVLLAPIEALMSFSSMEAHCTGNGGFRVAHLALAATCWRPALSRDASQPRDEPVDETDASARPEPRRPRRFRFGVPPTGHPA